MENEMMQTLVLVEGEYGGRMVVATKQVQYLTECVVVSKEITVEFEPLPTSDILKNQIDALDAREEILKREFEEKLQDIQNRKAQLLCLPSAV